VGFSEELLYVGARRKYTYRLAEQVTRDVLNGDILLGLQQSMT
jgi:hypothetical protein